MTISKKILTNWRNSWEDRFRAKTITATNSHSLRKTNNIIFEYVLIPFIFISFRSLHYKLMQEANKFSFKKIL